MEDIRRGFTSASNASFDLACPGRHTAQKSVPESDDSTKDSLAGDRIHAALAGWIQPQTLSFEEREVFDACRELEKKCVRDYFGEPAPLPVRVIRELQDGSSRLWVMFSKDGIAYRHSGQTDVIFRSGTRAIICDYKTGRGDVPESSSNLQMRDQAVLVYGNHTLLEEIATAIIQPLVSQEPQICAYDKEALQRAQVEMYERVIASNNPASKRVAGEVQCSYCRAKKNCVEYQKFHGSLTPPAMLQVLEVPMASWTPEQRTTAANALAPAQKFLDELKEFLKEGLKADPAFLPGWALKPGNRVETISDPQTCFDRFVLALGPGIPIEDKLAAFMRSVKVGKGGLREEMGAALNVKGKALDKMMAALTDGIVEVKENQPSLVKSKERQ